MPEWITHYWLPLSCLITALILAAGAVGRARSRQVWSWQLALPAFIVGSFCLGDASRQVLISLELEPWKWFGLTLAVIAVASLMVMAVVVIVKGSWSALLGYGLTCLFFIGLGDFAGRPMQDALAYAGAFCLSIRTQEPWWLLLLLFMPALIWTSWRNLVSLGTTRRGLVLGLRCMLILFLALALAEVFARKPNDNVTVLFVWDRSLSIPPELAQGRDLREERLFAFINQSVERRGTQHANDRVGVIVFGKQPRLELPPSVVPKLNFKKVLSQIDSSYTDIAAAMKLALASFPEGSGKRIVLVSDGNENMGRVEEQARIAKQNGVQVDIVPIDAKRNQQNEILIERLEAPPITEKDSRLPLRVVVRSFHPQIVVAQLHVRKMTFGQEVDLKQDPKDLAKNATVIELRQGLNVFYFQQAGAKDDTAFSYEATVVPIGVKTHDGAWVHKGLPGDRIENNAARASVMARGQRTVLLLEGEKGRHQLLVDRLQAVKTSLKVVALTINTDPQNAERNVNELHHYSKGDPERLATFLSRFDAIVLANLAAEALSETEQKVIRSQVHDQGSGLVMIGGHQSFGAGGWQNTEVEKALPVNMDLKSMKVEGKSGLVLIMHASEMAEGNAWQRKIAKLALEKLSPMDMVGQIHYDHGFNGGNMGHRWHIPFQEIGANRNRLLRLVDSMQPGDMPDVDPAFVKAHKELTNPEYQLGTKHIILISDGDHWDASPGVMTKLRNAKITCTTVCITTHGRNEVDKMRAVAQFTKGRAYHIKDPSELPAIYVKETRLVSQSFVHEGPFAPILLGREGPTEGIKDLNPLHGFVRTTPKESSLVRVLIETPKIGEYQFPILAAWQYGLGRSVAFTSDARTLAKGSVYWDRDWANSDLYAKFWEQTADWVLRPGESGQHLFLTTEHKDGKIRIIVEAQEPDKTPITDAEIKAGMTSPMFKVKDDRKTELKFEQKNAGVYEAEISADEVGAYFINIQAKWKRESKKDGKTIVEDVTDTVRGGVTIPYSPEFAEMESNPSLLERLRDVTGGKAYRDNTDALDEAVRRSDVFRRVPESHSSLQPLWPWFVVLTALCLLLDVAVRRIAIEPEAVWAKLVTKWERLRGQANTDDKAPAYIERLKSRKAQVSETMDKEKSAKKFEAGEDAKGASAPIVVSAAPTDKPKPATKQPTKDEDADFATRLMRAKKKAMEDRDKDKPK